MSIADETVNDDRDMRERERKTVELCGEASAGHRCILTRGHDGHHESHTATTVHSWK